jgi:6-phosphogluconolactonase/glucosamine-6-phosphate isomerase/deaminase
MRQTKCSRDRKPSVLIQEQTGIHVSISTDLTETARHAASIMKEKYQLWLERDRFAAWGRYKRDHFTIAVGGGNTVKAEYRAWLAIDPNDIDWVKHIRFFLLEESSGESNWENVEHSLITNFIVPLANKLIRKKGINAIAGTLALDLPVDREDVIDAMIATMVNPINMLEVRQALDAGKPDLALKNARTECNRYQRDIKDKVGGDMAFHLIVSGIGKDGTIGAFAPYTDELQIKDPSVVVLKQGDSALRMALSRGVLVNAESISLIVSGSLKLKALGRFEMEETADFEQTVMETPLRMLRETDDIAEKVYIFADEQALHFEETVFEYTENGNKMQNRAETREGGESDGIHILLLHGFLGLFSFTSFLIRLPSAWTVSALHRGSHAKTLDNDDIFPHYARGLRKAILKNWRQGRAAPIAGHSIAGVISDHLLLSIIGDYEGPIPPYEKLKKEDRQLVDALRASGIIHLATWAPSDGPHTGENIKNVVSHYRQGAALDYSGFERTYETDSTGGFKPADEETLAASNKLTGLDRFLQRRIARPVINAMNIGIRYWLNNKTVQQRMLNTDSPYVMRLIGGRLLKKVSFYGLCKEVNAALHHPVEYQRRHLKALEILLAYDIPFLSIIHQDDFLVSANRHREEHEYLVARRMKKEGVGREEDLRIPARYIMLRREEEELPVDPLNPHLMIMSTSTEGNNIAREITAAMTSFVNENVARAIEQGELKPLESVGKWAEQHRPTRSGRKKKAA